VLRGVAGPADGEIGFVWQKRVALL